MQKLIETLKQQVGCNVPTDNTKIHLTNVKLKQIGLPEIPNELAQLLQACNGFSNDGALVFGVENPNNHWFGDVYEFNCRFFRKQSAQWLILGRDECFYLIYEPAAKKYHIIEQDSFEPTISSQSIVEPLSFLLKLE